MSKWRPSPACIFIIPDIHGHYSCLNLILKRILPLRIQDQLIFLGDYIDRGPNSNKVINKLIELKKLFPEQVVFLRGNHEELLLQSFGYLPITKILSPF